MTDAKTVLPRVLALDTSTDRLSVVLGVGGQAPLCAFRSAGGPQASASLIPAIRDLLDGLGWPLASLDAIAFTHGPGAFTGLRTACAVVQGLAVAGRAGGIPVLPISTLQVMAEVARQQWAAQGQPPSGPVLALLDARMDEVYAAWMAPPADPADATDPITTGPLVGGPWLCAPEALARTVAPWVQAAGTPWLAGNALAVHGARLSAHWPQAPSLAVWPDAEALLRLAPAAWRAGAAVAAAHAQPLYVRDQVALTTEEREQRQRAQAASGAAL